MYYVCAAFQENVTLDGDDLLGDCLDQLSSVGVLHVGIGWVCSYVLRVGIGWVCSCVLRLAR